MTSWIDRMITPFSPSWALKRQQSRNALDLARAYEAAGHNRRTKGWRTASSSANAEIDRSLKPIRDRARALVRDDAYAKRAKRVWKSNTVGEGIIASGDEKIMALWDTWVNQCDADDVCDFYGLQSLLSGTVYEAGECLVRFIHLGKSSDLEVPLQIQLLEPDHLDHEKTEVAKSGNVIIQGVEFDQTGKRVAYWIFPVHPGDQFIAQKQSFKSIRIEAKEIKHIFWIDRPSQIRGISELAPVILQLRDLGDYEDAELVRKKIEACFAAFVTNDGSSDNTTIADAQRDKSGRLVEKLVPGLIKYLNPGEDVSFASPSNSGGHAEYIRHKLHGISAGLNVTYQQLTGDLSQANYSSMRGGLMEFRKPVKEFQRQVIIHQFCRTVEREFIKVAKINGKLKKTPKPLQWTPPAFDPVDPLKDVLADIAAVRGGFKTLKRAIAERGGDPQHHLQELKEIAKLLDEAGLVLDSDPRKTAKSGSYQDIQKIMGDTD